MSEKAKNYTASWVSILVIALGICSKIEDNYRQLAHRLDLKIMTLELQRNPEVIPRMNVWRNTSRAKAERWEIAVIALSIAAGLAATAMAASGLFHAILSAISLVFATSAIISVIAF